MKRKLVAAEIAALVFAAFVIGQSLLLQVEPATPYDGRVIIAIGDSITTGYGIPKESGYIAIISRRIKVPIINKGVTGSTTADALLRLERDVLSKHPDIVIIFLGGNDFFQNIPPEITFANLRQIINAIHGQNARVLLIGINKGFLSTYEREFEKIVYEKNVAGYIPDILGGISLRPDLLSDDIHPNERGHEIIAQRILPELERILQSSL